MPSSFEQPLEVKGMQGYVGFALTSLIRYLLVKQKHCKSTGVLTKQMHSWHGMPLVVQGGFDLTNQHACLHVLVASCIERYLQLACIKAPVLM